MTLNQRKGEMSERSDASGISGLPSDRRACLSLVECYKIVFGYYLNFEDFFKFTTT